MKYSSCLNSPPLVLTILSLLKLSQKPHKHCGESKLSTPVVRLLVWELNPGPCDSHETFITRRSLFQPTDILLNNWLHLQAFSTVLLLLRLVGWLVLFFLQIHQCRNILWLLSLHSLSRWARSQGIIDNSVENLYQNLCLFMFSFYSLFSLPYVDTGRQASFIKTLIH